MVRIAIPQPRRAPEQPEPVPFQLPWSRTRTTCRPVIGDALLLQYTLQGCFGRITELTVRQAREMLGSAVSSSTPTDFHPNSVMGLGDRPLMKRRVLATADLTVYLAETGAEAAGAASMLLMPRITRPGRADHPSEPLDEVTSAPSASPARLFARQCDNHDFYRVDSGLRVVFGYHGAQKSPRSPDPPGSSPLPASPCTSAPGTPATRPGPATRSGVTHLDP
jgi:hypothetical protein